MVTLFLTGFMGSGKTTLGQMLAKEFNMNFFDTDEELVKIEKKNIAEIFKEKGEQYFRDKEKEILRKIQPRNTIISLGGGIVKDPDNINFIKSIGKTIFLRENTYTVLDRLSKVYKTRPLLEGHFNDIDIEHMLKIRNPLYESLCNAIIDVDGKTKDEVFLDILPYFNEWSKAEVFLKIF